MKMMNPTWYTVALAAALAGCSTASGPTFKAYQVNPQDGQPTYRVECHGLLQGQEVCQKKAQEMCGNQAVRPIEPVTPYGKQEVDVRTLTFQCGAAPVAEKPRTPQPPAVVVAPVAVKRLELGGDANFDTDKATLTPVAHQRLDKLVADAQGHSFKQVEVDGYTDARGSAAHNMDLSDRRANSVAEYLRAQGLQAGKWSVRGHGKADPVASNATSDGRARNRRVEIGLTE